jgi:hypothetical protein
MKKYVLVSHLIKNKLIIFDSGMYSGNNRNYSQFRSINNNFWKTLITEEY